MRPKFIAAIAVCGLAVILAGCSGSPATPDARFSAVVPSSSSASAPQVTAVPAPPASSAKSVAQLSTALESVDFDATRFRSTQDMLDSVHAGLEAKDPACMLPFGIGWADDENGSLAWGPDSDRSLTAVASSSGDTDAAAKLISDIRAAVDTCAGEPGQYTFHGVPVQMSVQPVAVDVTGADEAHGWSATATIDDVSLSLTGAIARAGGDDVMVVGWDPTTAQRDVSTSLSDLIAAL